MTTIYILELQGGNYYIGKTSNVIQRYQQHLNGEGSAWTIAHPPVSLVKTIENASVFDEDKVTKEYMAKYGMDKVRGGTYVEMELSAAHKQVLQKEIWSAKGLCTGCGKHGHFVKDCYTNKAKSASALRSAFTMSQPRPTYKTYTKSYEYEESEESEYESEYESEDEDEYAYQKDTCYRCGRQGHYSSNCYATTSVKRW